MNLRHETFSAELSYRLRNILFRFFVRRTKCNVILNFITKIINGRKIVKSEQWIGLTFPLLLHRKSTLFCHMNIDISSDPGYCRVERCAIIPACSRYLFPSLHNHKVASIWIWMYFKQWMLTQDPVFDLFVAVCTTYRLQNKCLAVCNSCSFTCMAIFLFRISISAYFRLFSE